VIQFTAHSYAVPEGEPAGPSTTLRSGRDDKGESGA
jgi:hypothetical protein